FITTTSLPRSSSFPYTTLFRSLVHRRECGRHLRARPGGGLALDAGTSLLHVPLDRGGQRFPAGIRETTGSSGARGRELAERALRSEEHTSELQSRVDLVCRLLL